MELNEVKKAMLYKTPVTHRGIDYQYITKCILYLKGREWKYSAELLGRRGRSVTIADIHEINVIKDDEVGERGADK